MAITKAILEERIEAALNFEADKEVKPEEARKRIAQKLASAVNDFIIGRATTGTSSDGATVATTIK